MEHHQQTNDYASIFFSHNYYYPYLPFCDYWNQVYFQTSKYQILGIDKNLQRQPQQLLDERVNFVHASSSEAEKSEQQSNHQSLRQKPENCITKQKPITERLRKKITDGKYNTNSSQQKENRNVFSNILRNFFRMVNDTTNIRPLVEKIIRKKGLTLLVDDFVSYIKRLRVNHGKYLRFKKVRHIFTNEGMKEHSMVFRILLQHFTNEHLLPQTLTSRKIGRWSVILHLKGSRDMNKRLYE